jgi:hypothetical protein
VYWCASRGQFHLSQDFLKAWFRAQAIKAGSTLTKSGASRLSSRRPFPDCPRPFLYRQEEHTSQCVHEAVKLSGVSSRTIHKRIEKDDIHFMETEDGLVQICPVSLFGQIDSPDASTETNNFSLKIQVL